MRVTYAVDRSNGERYSDNLPACLLWARDRTLTTGKPVEVLSARPGGKVSRVALVTPEGVALA